MLTTTHVVLDDIIGRVEAENILAVRPRTFSRLLADGKLPEPVKTLADGTRLWLGAEIRRYAESRK